MWTMRQHYHVPRQQGAAGSDGERLLFDHVFELWVDCSIL